MNYNLNHQLISFQKLYLKDMKKGKADTVELLDRDIDMETMLQWQLLN